MSSLAVPSRRQFALGTVSGVLLATASRGNSYAHALQTTPAATPTPTLPAYNNDFAAYAKQQSDALILKKLGGSATPSDLNDFASVLRSVAKQMSNTTFDQQFKQLASATTVSQVMALPNPSTVTTGYIMGLNPAINPSLLPVFPDLNATQMATCLTAVQASGCSGSLQMIADVVTALANTPSSLIAAAYLVDHNASHAHVLHVSCFICSIQNICTTLSISIATAGLLAALIGALCFVAENTGSIPEILPLCGALAASANTVAVVTAAAVAIYLAMGCNPLSLVGA